MRHFFKSCPCQKREHKPRFPKKNFVKKLLPNPMNSKFKKRDGKTMVAQEESNLDDVGGVACVSLDSQNMLKLFNKEGDVVKYIYMKDYMGNTHN